MYIQVFVHLIYVLVYPCTCTCIYIHVCIRTLTCMYMYLYTYVHVCTLYSYIYVHVYVLYVHVHVTGPHHSHDNIFLSISHVLFHLRIGNQRYVYIIETQRVCPCVVSCTYVSKISLPLPHRLCAYRWNLRVSYWQKLSMKIQRPREENLN